MVLEKHLDINLSIMKKMKMKKINTDEVVAKIGSWKDNNIQIRCARETAKLLIIE